MKTNHRTCERGVIMIEASLSIFPFLLVIITGMELLRFAYYDLATQYVVADSARFGSLGSNCQNCSASARANEIQNYITQEASKFGVTLENQDICIQTDPAASCGLNNSNDNSGSPNQLFAIKVKRPVDFFFTLGQLNISAEAMAKNEPFGVN